MPSYSAKTAATALSLLISLAAAARVTVTSCISSSLLGLFLMAATSCFRPCFVFFVFFFKKKLISFLMLRPSEKALGLALAEMDV